MEKQTILNSIDSREYSGKILADHGGKAIDIKLQSPTLLTLFNGFAAEGGSVRNVLTPVSRSHRSLKEKIDCLLARKIDQFNVRTVIEVNGAMESTSISGLYVEQPHDPKKGHFLFLFKEVSEIENPTPSKATSHQNNSIVEFMEEGYFKCSSNGTLLYVNASLAKNLGYASGSELIGMNFDDICFDKAVFNEVKNDLLEKATVKNKPIKFSKKDHLPLFTELKCRSVSQSEGTRFYDGLIYGLHQNGSENELEGLKMKLKKTNAELDRFLYSAWHDIRSPLASVLGICGLLKTEFDQNTMAIKYVKLIESSISKLDAFLLDVASFNKNIRRKVKNEKLNIPEIVKTTINTLKLSVDSPLKIEVSEPNDVVFYSDRNRIFLIIRHIIKNSMQYLDESKKQSFLKIDITGKGDKIIFEFEDNGVGIKDTYQTKIFDMFYKGSEKSKGSGLGLYLVKEAVEKLGGKIVMNTELNIGTTFTVEIPNSIKGVLATRKLMLSKHFIAR
ncbi:MAG: PAS domain-containing sensor histidine kinase [Bacteroidota bacterium]